MVLFSAAFHKLDKVCKNGPSKNFGRQPLQKLESASSIPYHFNSFKGCLPQILLGPFSNTFSQIAEVVVPGCSTKYLFLKFFKNSQENICAGVSIQMQALRPAFVNRDSSTDFSFEFCKVFKNNFYTEHLLNYCS